MSTLRTFNLQHPESSNNNIQLAEGGGVSVTAGILTATNVSSTNVTTTNVTTTEVTATNGTFSGNLSVSGVLSYEDVTNVDSTGIGTFRDGLHVTGGNVGIGTDNANVDLHLHDSSLTRIQFTDDSTGAAAGDGVILGLNGDDNFFINNRETSKDILLFTEDTERLRITSTGKCEVYKGTSTTGKTLGSEAFTVGNGANNKRFSVYPDGSTVIGGQGVINNYNILLQNNGQAVFSGIGIGTATPGRHLTVSGGASEGAIQITNNTSGHTAANGFELIHFTSGETQLLNRENGAMRFDTNGVERLRITSNGSIGISDASPSDKLTVYNSSIGNPTGITIRNTEASSTYSHARLRLESQNGAAYAHLWADVANSALRLGYNGSSTVNIKSNGNLGVGIMDPTQAKFVAQTASGMSIAAVKDNTGASISLGGVTQPRILMEAGASASQFKLYTASGSSYSSAGWRQRLHITDTSASVASTGSGANGIGCFGIADNSPDSRALALSIGGGSGAYGFEDPRPLVYLQRSYGIGGGSSTDETTLEVNAPGSYNSAGIIYGIKSRAQHNLNGSHYAGHFEAHGSQYSANGTSALYAKTTKLDTNGSGDVIAFRADASITQGSTNSGAAIAGYFASGNNINGKPIVCQNGLTSNNWANQIIFRKHNGSNIVDVGSIKSSNTATQYNTSSDYRLKENIVSLTGAIDRLKQLQPKRFNFIGVDETIDGFIAHEVTSVVPYAVSGEKDAVKKELVMGEDGKEQFDENGEIITEEVIDPQSVDYSKLTTLTIAALQEALAKIETLEAKVAVLEGS